VSLAVTIYVKENRITIHTESDTTVYMDLATGALYTELPSGYFGYVAEAEPVSAYPALDDLPCDGWVWYDESAGTAPITTNESR
jgi:hypothetical protein